MFFVDLMKNIILPLTELISFFCAK